MRIMTDNRKNKRVPFSNNIIQKRGSTEHLIALLTELNELSSRHSPRRDLMIILQDECVTCKILRDFGR